MIKNLNEIKTKVNVICKKMKSPFPLPKIYIDDEDDTNLNLLCIPYELIDKNSRFINYNADVLFEIIDLKRMYNMRSLYLELNFNTVKYINFFNEYSINEKEFVFIESNPLMIKTLERKKKLSNDYVTVKELIIFISLFEIKEVMKIIQYMRYANLFEISIIKNVFDGYIEKINKERGLYELNNFSYIRDAIFSPFSLNDLDIEFLR